MRPSKDQYFIDMVMLVATRATCKRRNVGCILVNDRGHVIATGYNGVAAGMPHCNAVQILVTDVKFDNIDANEKVLHYPNACAGAFCKSGEGLDLCEAIHAEANALLQCKDVFEIDTAYVTTQPCIHCTKLLMNTSCKRIVYIEDYPHSTSKELWERGGRTMLKYSEIASNSTIQS